MNIKEKKASKDTNTSRIYAKFGIEIYAAAKQGEPDPELNQKLKFVIEKAKTYNVPKHIIDRAIEKAKGSGEENYFELRYEGFGPSGSMFIVDTLTDNVNRTASMVRAAFGKNGGNMGVSGSVSYLFDETAVIGINYDDEETVLEWLLEADADVREIIKEDDHLIIYAEPSEFQRVQTVLKEQGIQEFNVAELVMLPQNEVILTGDDLAQAEKLIDALEELEDVQNVYHNIDEIG